MTLTPGQHMITSDGVDTENPTTTGFGPLLETKPWYDVVTGTTPSDDPSALVVRHEFDGDVYATVFGQLITATRGALRVASSATPWIDGTWREQSWSEG